MKIKADLLEKIKAYGIRPQTPVSIKQMVDFGKTPTAFMLLRGSQFVHKELPIRLAHRVLELDSLPLELSQMPSILQVKDWYTQSFQDLIDLKYFKTAFGEHQLQYYQAESNRPVSDDVREYITNLSQCIQTIKTRHNPTQIKIAHGILELKEHWRKTNNSLCSQDNYQMLPTTIQAFLDRFYLSRIGIRMLISQHIALSKTLIDPNDVEPDYVGIICTNTDVSMVAQDAIDNARSVCQDYYGLFNPPQVKLLGVSNVKFMYIPSHLHHMMFELLKNSLRAVVERYGIDEEYPEIKVIVAQGKEDITIKISDEGGGIPRSGIPMIWTYMYTTAEEQLISADGHVDSRTPLAGFGYGLPISRLYARYFGGDLRLISMEGYGTDAYLHLSRLSDSDEPLS